MQAVQHFPGVGTQKSDVLASLCTGILGSSQGFPYNRALEISESNSSEIGCLFDGKPMVWGTTSGNTNVLQL